MTKKSQKPWENLQSDYMDEVNSGLQTMDKGWKQFQTSPDMSWERGESLLNLLLGGAQYMGAPGTAGLRSLISRPVENVTGVPQEATEFGAAVLPIFAAARAQQGTRVANKLLKETDPEMLEDLGMKLLPAPAERKALPAPKKLEALPGPNKLEALPKKENIKSLPQPEWEKAGIKFSETSDGKMTVSIPKEDFEYNFIMDGKYRPVLDIKRLRDGGKYDYDVQWMPQGEISDAEDTLRQVLESTQNTKYAKNFFEFPLPTIRTPVNKYPNEASADIGEMIDLQKRAENLEKFLNPSQIKNRLYHASNTDHASFVEKLPADEDGFFLTSDPKYAEPYGDSIYPVYVQAENPYVPSSFDMTHRYEFPMRQGIPHYRGYSMERLIDDAKLAGHDSIIIPRMEDIGGIGDQIIMFDASKIKSAFNKGHFNTNDSRLLYGLGGAALVPNALLPEKKEKY